MRKLFIRFPFSFLPLAVPGAGGGVLWVLRDAGGPQAADVAAVTKGPPGPGALGRGAGWPARGGVPAESMGRAFWMCHGPPNVPTARFLSGPTGHPTFPPPSVPGSPFPHLHAPQSLRGRVNTTLPLRVCHGGQLCPGHPPRTHMTPSVLDAHADAPRASSWPRTCLGCVRHGFASGRGLCP